MVASSVRHIFVDDKEAIICIPVTECAWHVMLNTPVDNKWYGMDADYARSALKHVTLLIKTKFKIIRKCDQNYGVFNKILENKLQK